ncbi:MAG: YoaP domain-containing protein [Spirochaetota bacterium]
MSSSKDVSIISLKPDTIGTYGVCGYKDGAKHPAVGRKIEWFSRYYPKGLRMLALISAKSGYQGMIEYLPGKHAHRPVRADGFMFIHCIFTGFRKEFKDKGFGSSLIEACEKDAKREGMHGVAVITRQGPFMSGHEIFKGRGYKKADTSPPDFELWSLSWNAKAAMPSFAPDLPSCLTPYRKGLTIFRSPQCPYTERNVREIIETAKNDLGIRARIIDMDDAKAAQACPSPFGTFCIVHNGDIITHHPISDTRFRNIMRERQVHSI